MTQNSKDWWRIESSGQRCVIQFQPCLNGEWCPAVLGESPLPRVFLGRQVLLEGKAPLWMYAHAAIVARRAGAASIDVFQPQQTHPVRIFPLPENASEDPGWLSHRRDPAGGGIVEFHRHPKGALWLPGDLGSLLHAAAAWDEKLLTLTGPAPNWLIAAVACLAHVSAPRIVTYFAPRDGFGILLNADPGQKVELPPSPSLLRADGRRGRVIGIVGDPNSGKSVFSMLLERGFHAAGCHSLWRLDCDHAAPTPHWYLQMMGQERSDEAREIRERQKREWTATAEHSLAQQLQHCAASLQWVIADFPGGIHKREPVQRIPPGRELLIGQAGLLVILSRRDKPESEAGWREALQRHGFESRITAIVDSVHWQAPLDLRLTDGSPIRAEVDGLDRRNLADPDLWQNIKPWAALAEMIINRSNAVSGT
jgi:hypothetical protein